MRKLLKRSMSRLRLSRTTSRKITGRTEGKFLECGTIRGQEFPVQILKSFAFGVLEFLA